MNKKIISISLIVFMMFFQCLPQAAQLSSECSNETLPIDNTFFKQFKQFDEPFVRCYPPIAQFLFKCLNGTLATDITLKQLNHLDELSAQYNDFKVGEKTFENQRAPINVAQFHFATVVFVRNFFDEINQNTIIQSIKIENSLPLKSKRVEKLLYYYVLGQKFRYKELCNKVVDTFVNFFKSNSIYSSQKVASFIDEIFTMPDMQPMREVFVNLLVKSLIINNILQPALLHESKNISVAELLSLYMYDKIRTQKNLVVDYAVYPYSSLIAYLKKIPQPIKELFRFPAFLLSVENLKQNNDSIVLRNNSSIVLQIESIGYDIATITLPYDALNAIKFLNLNHQQTEENINVALPFSCNPILAIHCLELMFIQDSPKEFTERLKQYSQNEYMLESGEIHHPTRVMNKLASYLVIADFLGLEQLKEKLERYTVTYVMKFPRDSSEFLNNFLSLYTTMHTLGNSSGLAAIDLVKIIIEENQFTLTPAYIDLKKLISYPTEIIDTIELSNDLHYAVYIIRRNEHDTIYVKRMKDNALLGSYSSLNYERDEQGELKKSFILAFNVSFANSLVVWIDQDYMYGVHLFDGTLLFKENIADKNYGINDLKINNQGEIIIIKNYGEDSATQRYAFFDIHKKLMQNLEINLQKLDSNQENEDQEDEYDEDNFPILTDAFFSIQGKYYALIDSQNRTYIMDSATKNIVHILKGVDNTKVCFSPIDDSVIAYRTTIDSIVIKNFITNTVINSFKFYNKGDERVALMFNNKGNKLALLDFNKNLLIKDLDTQLLLKYTIANYSTRTMPHVFFDTLDNLILEFNHPIVMNSIAAQELDLYSIAAQELDFTLDSFAVLKLGLMLSKKPTQNPQHIQAYNKRLEEIKALLRNYQNQNYDEPPPKKRKTSDKS